MASYPLTPPSSKGKGVTEFKIEIIADLDKRSKDVDEDGEIIWKSEIQIGRLTFDEINKKVSVVMDGAPMEVISEYSRGMRGMELSELITYNGVLYSVNDRTGIVFSVSSGKAIPWIILAGGDGKSTAKGFKGEWMTRKDGYLYVGGHGLEIANGETIVHKNHMWIKIIDQRGSVEHVNWEKNYNALRETPDCLFPGYLTHESCVWSDAHKEWFFLPRKISKVAFDEKLDEKSAGNILIRCSEDFSDLKFSQIGELRPTRGYSSFKFIPGTNDTVIVAIKTEEIGESQKSYITVFTIDGDILLDDQHLADMKYEGIEFV